jgi:hypothetical protein
MLDLDDVCEEAEVDYDDGGSTSGLFADDEDFEASVNALRATARSVVRRSACCPRGSASCSGKGKRLG